MGVSFVWNEISNDFQALVKDSRISDGADVQVQALSDSMIVGLSIELAMPVAIFPELLR